MTSTRFFRRLAAAALLSAALPAAAADVVAPADNLVADGLAPIPASLVEKVSPYLEQRTASFLGWHPKRREMLVSTRFGEVPQVHRVAMPGGARTQLTFYADRVSSAAWRPVMGGGFAFVKDIGGGEWFQIYFRDEKSGETTLLTDGKSRNGMGPFSRDGRWLSFSSTRRTGKDSDVWVVDPSDPKSARLLLEVSGGGWSPADFSPDGRTLLVHESISINESRFWLVDVASGAKTLLTPEGKDAWGGGRFTPDGKRVLVTTDRDAEFRRLGLLDVAAKRFEVLTPGIPWDVSLVDVTRDGRRAAFVVNEAGAETLHVLDLATRKELPLPKLPLGVLGGVGFTEDGSALGFSLSSARSPSDAYSIDLAAGKLERWTESETGGLDAARFVEPEPIAWRSFDGREITGFLYRPSARFAGPRPVIVSIHGGPEAQFQPGYQGRNNFYMDQLGVALLYPNVRGSAGFGKSFLKLDNAERREDSVKDIGALLDWIAKQPGLDASRVMVMGGSYGGYMTLASMVHFQDRIRCAIDVVGISSFVTFLESTESYRQDLRRVEYGDERDPQMRAFLERVSPLTNAGRITKPMFIVQGKNDPRVPFTEAEQIVKAVRLNGGPVWYLLAKDEGHGFAKKRNQDFQFLATLVFVEKYLLN